MEFFNRKYVKPIFFAAFLLFAFFGGILIGTENTADMPKTENLDTELYSASENQDAADSAAEAASADSFPEPIHYLVQASDNSLTLYEVNGESKILIKDWEIDIGLLPPSDAARLKDGITAPTKEKGFEIAEDFIT